MELRLSIASFNWRFAIFVSRWVHLSTYAGSSATYLKINLAILGLSTWISLITASRQLALESLYCHQINICQVKVSSCQSSRDLV